MMQHDFPRPPPFRALTGLLLGALTLAACAYTPRHTATPDILGLAGDVTRGEPLYQAHCATCHGADLKGNDIGPSLTVRLALYDDARVIDTVMLGKGEQMPPMAELLDHQNIRDIVAYLRAQE